MKLLITFLQENASFLTQVDISVYRYLYRTTGEGPVDSMNKF